MILSASRRTDIPSFYGEWMMNRLRAGEIWVQNPNNHAQNTRLRFTPETVDCIVFWTKNPEPFLRFLPELDSMGYRYLFQYTLNPYGHDLEPGLPSLAERADTFRRLYDKIGPDRVLWRYDPIIVNDSWTVARHEEAFGSLCTALAPLTSQVTVSFVQRYRKITDPAVIELPEEGRRIVAKAFGKIAADERLKICACCSEISLSEYGIVPASCIGKEQLEKVCGAPLILKKDHNQRKGCGCYESVDIGTYNTCPRGCTYCYANLSHPMVERSVELFDPKSPCFCSEIEPQKLRTRDAVSNLLLLENEQITF